MVNRRNFLAALWLAPLAPVPEAPRNDVVINMHPLAVTAATHAELARAMRDAISRAERSEL